MEPKLTQQPKTRRRRPKWMTLSAYSIVGMLPADPNQAREVLRLTIEMIDAAEKEKVI